MYRKFQVRCQKNLNTCTNPSTSTYTYVQVCAHVFLTTDLTFPVCMFPQLLAQLSMLVMNNNNQQHSNWHGLYHALKCMTVNNYTKFMLRS